MVRFAIIGCLPTLRHLSQVNAPVLCSAIDKGEAESDRLLASTPFHDASRQCRFNRSAPCRTHKKSASIGSQSARDFV